MKTHYTAAELAEMKLPGLPKDERNIRDIAADEGWPFEVAKARGGPGGVVRKYALTALPLDARIEIARRRAARNPPPPSPPSAARPIKPLDNKAQARLDTHLAVLRALDKFLADGALPRWTGMHAFCRAYNTGQVPVPPDVLAQVHKVSVGSLENWRKKVAKDGANALAGKYGNRAGTSIIDTNPAIKDFVVGNLLAKPHLDAAQLIKGLRARFADAADVTLPSYRSLQRWLAGWKVEYAEEIMAVGNPDAWKSRHMPGMGSRSAKVLGLNDLWEADSTPTDLLLTDGRYTLVGVIDVWSRRGKVLVTPTSKAVAVTTCLRRAIMAFGVPKAVKTDNGQDYVARHVDRALADLGIEHPLCTPFKPEEKPHIERFLGTVSHQFIEMLPGYIGHSVADRKAIEARKSFAQRLKTEAGDLLCVEMTAAELQAKIDDWCEYVYGRDAHGGLGGKSPFERAAEWTGEVRRVTDERALDILLAEAPGGDGTRTVNKDGIKLDNTRFIASELYGYSRQKVHVRLDPADMGKIYVYHGETGEFICIAESPERTGIDPAEVAARGKVISKEKISGFKKEARRTKKAAKADALAEMILGHAKEQAEKVVTMPRKGTAHETPALGQAAVAARHGKGIKPTPLTDAQKRAQADLEAEMAARPAARVVTLAGDTREARFARALDVERRLAAGGDVSAEDAAWHVQYRSTSEYRGQRIVYDDFNGSSEIGQSMAG